MNTRLHGLHWSILTALMLLAACGGGSTSYSVNTTIPHWPRVLPPGPVTAFGVTTGEAGLTIGGVRFETGLSAVTVNGQGASPSDLEPGQIVLLEGTINQVGATGTADRIVCEEMVIGPVESVDEIGGHLVVMGQTVVVDANTVLGPQLEQPGLSGLTPGAVARISGFRGVGGDVLATRIALDLTSVGFQVDGTASGLDAVNGVFVLDSLTVDYAGATLVELPGGAPDKGMRVLVRGSLIDGVLVATELHPALAPDDETTGEILVEGLVTRLATTVEFDLGGFRVSISTTTWFDKGTLADILPNARVVVSGRRASFLGRFVAHGIHFARVVGPTTTRSYDLSDFTAITISNGFAITVKQGSTYSVEVTLDEDIVDDLEVSQTGETLNLGLNSEVHGIARLEAVVTLPYLEAIGLDGITDATLVGFDQESLRVDLAGTCRLRGSSLTIDELIADVTGISRLDLGGARPLESAQIRIAGVSSATLNMASGSTVTGSVTGPSALLYYGSDVVLDVTRDFVSRVVRLGETRP